MDVRDVRDEIDARDELVPAASAALPAFEARSASEINGEDNDLDLVSKFEVLGT